MKGVPMRERDFVGYANRPPIVEWPNGARLAVSVVVNYEEGSERSLAFGDDMDEPYGEWGSFNMPEGVRNLTQESFFEYGSRVGVWRILDILDDYQVPASFFACAVAFERNPVVARAIVERGHEVCSHGYRWEDHFGMSRDEDRERIRRAISSFQSTTGQRPIGWYSRNGLTLQTRELLLDEGFLYDSNEYNEDVPYFMNVNGRQHLIVPYAADSNDSKCWRSPGYVTSDMFAAYLIDSFDCLLAEAAEVPKMMSVGLHVRISGRPGRSVALRRFLEYAKKRPGVWFARRDHIAQWWLEHDEAGAKAAATDSVSG
jgi:peptidoglycan/xylan/chitin deacetylase (PgdA/CDA1 family)